MDYYQRMISKLIRELDRKKSKEAFVKFEEYDIDYHLKEIDYKDEEI